MTLLVTQHFYIMVSIMVIGPFQFFFYSNSSNKLCLFLCFDELKSLQGDFSLQVIISVWVCGSVFFSDRFCCWGGCQQFTYNSGRWIWSLKSQHGNSTYHPELAKKQTAEQDIWSYCIYIYVFVSRVKVIKTELLSSNSKTLSGKTETTARFITKISYLPLCMSE